MRTIALSEYQVNALLLSFSFELFTIILVIRAVDGPGLQRAGPGGAGPGRAWPTL